MLTMLSPTRIRSHRSSTITTIRSQVITTIIAMTSTRNHLPITTTRAVTTKQSKKDQVARMSKWTATAAMSLSPTHPITTETTIEGVGVECTEISTIPIIRPIVTIMPTMVAIILKATHHQAPTLTKICIEALLKGMPLAFSGLLDASVLVYWFASSLPGFKSRGGRREFKRSKET